MDFTFPEILILILISLLFARDYILPSLLKKLGLGNGENKNGYQLQIDELREHAKIANEEMSEVKERLIGIETKLDIIMRHLKI